MARLRVRLGEDAVEDVVGLSPLQEGMLFHTLASADHDLYTVQQRIEIDGALDIATFRRAWSHTVARHPALRVAFAWQHRGRPVQIVCRGVDVPLAFHDLRNDPHAEATVAAAFEADRREPFTLDEPPLMRLAVFQTSADHHVLLWNQHHLLQDGWSAANVLRDVFGAYETLLQGKEPALPPVPPFADYVSWLETRDAAETEAFWRRELEGFAVPTRMVPAIADASYRGYTRRFRALSRELTHALEDFARVHRVSVNTVLVGALSIALTRYLGRSEVAFGIVASGRPPTLPDVEAMVGMFINTLILRIDVDEDAAVAEWLPEVQSRQAALLEHEHTAMTDVQSWSELGPATTLTDTLFAYWNFGGTGESPSGSLRYRTVDGYGRTSFPFSVTVEAADPINVGLDFDAGDLSTEFAEQFLVHYATLLESIVADPDAAVGELEMLTAAEREAMAAYNATDDAAGMATVLDAFRTQVARRPDAPAVIGEGPELTFAELDAASDRVARRVLEVAGLSAPRVAVLLPRTSQMVVAVLGVLKAGASYVPIDRHTPVERVRFVLDDSRAALVLTDAAHRTVVPEGLPVAELPLGEDDPAGLDFEMPIDAGDSAYVMYTSGSTGRPKGVTVSHGNLANYITWASRVYGGDEPVSFPLYTSPGFDLTVTSLFAPLVSGGSVVVYGDDDPQDLSVLEVFEDDRVDVVKLTPSHLALLQPEHFTTRRIRTLILGGEELRTDQARMVHEASGGNVAVFNEYGPTEATVGCMIHHFDPAEDLTVVPIGRPAANARVYLLDHRLRPVPVGVDGEIYVGGEGVAKGYLNRPELDAERFVPDPFRTGGRMYRTGDIARWERPGVMAYRGRNDDQVKLRGYRIELGEIESALMEHPAVLNAAVAVREPRPGDVRLVAYYVGSSTVAATVTDLRRHLRDRLPDYMVSRHLVQIDELPLTKNGKLDRAALPDTIGEVSSSTAFVAPRDGRERLIADAVAELLGIERVSVRDNFFELGGHSILAMRLIAALHERTGVRLSPRVILLNTLEQAAARLPATGSLEAPGPEAPDDETPARATSAIGTSAYFFGSREEPLFGMHYAPSGELSRPGAVLLCPPLGWEYMRTHWALRRLARLLAAAGLHVLRFDYFATGDSAGRAGAGSIDRWIADIGAAAEELQTVAGDDRLAVVGVRLGATLAAEACAGGLAAAQLVLWDPVVSGANYLDTLEAMHAEMLASRRGRRPAADLLGDELLGFPYPSAERRRIRTLDLGRTAWTTPDVTLVASQDRPEHRRLAASAGEAVRLEVVPDAGAWDELSSSQAALLPMAIPSHIAGLIGGSL